MTESELYKELTNDPATFTPQQWVAHYARAEYELLEGKNVTLADGRSIAMEDLSTLRRARNYWQVQVNRQAHRRQGGTTFGGLSTQQLKL